MAPTDTINMTGALTPRILEDRAQIHLLLARAWLTPDGEQGLEMLRAAFVEDMRELCEALNRDTSRLDAFAESLDVFTDSARLLRVYSGLFLAPPVAVPLNASVHLGGELMAAPIDAVLAAYRRAGLEKADGFRDLPDHIAVQLEFMAWLNAQAAEQQRDGVRTGLSETLGEAERFLRCHLLSWLPALKGKLKRAASERDDDVPFLRLLELSECLLGDELTDLAAWALPDPKASESLMPYRPDVAIPADEAAQLAEIRQRLEAAGLGTDHLGEVSGGLDGSLDLKPLKPVLPRRGKGSGARAAG